MLRAGRKVEGAVDCLHVIQSKRLRLPHPRTTTIRYIPEIISVFLHIDYSANLLYVYICVYLYTYRHIHTHKNGVRGRGSYDDDYDDEGKSVYSLDPFSTYSLFFFLDVYARIYIESIFRQANASLSTLSVYERVPVD